MNAALGASVGFCVLFGLQIVLQSQYVREAIHPLQLMFLTNSVSFLILSAFFAVSRKSVFRVSMSRKTAVLFLSGTLLWIVADLSALAGLVTSTSVNFSIISRLQLFITYIGAVLFLGEPYVPRKVGALILAFVGTIIVVFGVETFQLHRGDVLFLVFALAISVSGLVRQKVAAHLSVWQITYIMFGISALVTGILVILFDPISTVPVLGFVVLNAVLGMVGFTMVNYAISRGGAAQFSLVSSLLPFITVVFAYLLLREAPTIRQCVGGAVILMSIVLFIKNFGKSGRG